MSVKVYVHYEEGSSIENHVTLKLTLPRKWVSEGCPQKILELFIESYNKRKPGQELSCDDYHLANSKGVIFKKQDIIGSVIRDRDDIYVKKGPMEDGKSDESCVQLNTAALKNSDAAISDPSLLRCRNYGCNKYFYESSNSDSACSYHVAPPIFHDTKKGWSCCEKRVYDWDEFQAIPGCHNGPHSIIDPIEHISAGKVEVKNEREATQPKPVSLKSISDFNAENPNVSTAVRSAVMSASERVCTRREDGTAKCQNKGCQKEFIVTENTASSCCYHRLNPVFHDTGKYWACCPNQVKYDFDDFLTIKGCCTGFHQDGSGEFHNND